MKELTGKKYDTGVVFIHGICSGPSFFDFLRPVVPQEWKVRMVALDGHGADALAFSRASMHRWREQAAQAVAEMAAECERVVGVGHSMGCLLLLEQAAEGRIDRLFLLNPPMRVRLRRLFFANIVNVASGRVEGDPVVEASAKAYSISLDHNPLHYYGWINRFLELFARMRRVRLDVLPRTACPIDVFFSTGDEMVALSSASPFEKHPTAHITILPGSTHLYYSPADSATIIAAFRGLPY